MVKRRKKTSEPRPQEVKKPAVPLDQTVISDLDGWSEEAAQAFDLLWFDTEVNSGWVIRVYVDRAGATGEPGTGVTIDKCVEVSRYLEGILDADERVPEHYRLEVSSPGIERALTKLRQIPLVIGRTVKVVTHEPIDGQNVFEGVLSSLDKEILEIQGETTAHIAWPDIAKARLTYDFSGAK